MRKINEPKSVPSEHTVSQPNNQKEARQPAVCFDPVLNPNKQTQDLSELKPKESGVCEGVPVTQTNRIIFPNKHSTKQKPKTKQKIDCFPSGEGKVKTKK